MVSDEYQLTNLIQSNIYIYIYIYKLCMSFTKMYIYIYKLFFLLFFFFYYLKDTNHFLKKIKQIGKLPEGAILFTKDVDHLYPNIPHVEDLAPLCKFLETRDNKQIWSDTLAYCSLKRMRLHVHAQAHMQVSLHVQFIACAKSKYFLVRKNFSLKDFPLSIINYKIL